MITVVTDVAYDDAASKTARAAAVVLADPTAAEPIATYVRDSPIAADYTPGALYTRELPALRELLVEVVARHAAELVIVDAHVQFRAGPGLGAHVRQALADAGYPVAVIGIAKNPHPDAVAVAVCRGGSERPLWVGAAGLDLARAAELVGAMAGPHRRPDAVTLADQLTRGLASPTAP